MKPPMQQPSRSARILATLAVVLNLLVACSRPQPPTVPLYRALQVGDLDQVKRHLAHGSPIDRPDANGDLPLHVAARAGQVAIARALLDHGAGLAAGDARGRTPLHLALANGRVEVAGLLVDWGAKDSPQDLLFALVEEGSADRDALAFLRERGADINGRDAAGQTPLHLALISRRVALAKRLILAGADLRLADGTGRAPLALAGSDPDLNRLLRQYGAGDPVKVPQPTSTPNPGDTTQ
jgi:ankyrin repeat protein